MSQNTQMYSAYDLNYKILPKLDMNQFETLQDLINKLELADPRQYMFMHPVTHKPLVAKSSLKNLRSLKPMVLRNQAGG